MKKYVKLVVATLGGLSLLSACASQTNDPSSLVEQQDLIPDQPNMEWFTDKSVGSVIDAQLAANKLGLIAVNRRGYYYPNVGYSKQAKTLKSGCQTWLVSGTSDALKNEQQKQQQQQLSAFAKTFNAAMQAKCLVE